MSKQRGVPTPAKLGDPPRELTVVATVHPSSVLRADDRKRAYAELVDDLAVAAGL